MNEANTTMCGLCVCGLLWWRGRELVRVRPDVSPSSQALRARDVSTCQAKSLPCGRKLT